MAPTGIEARDLVKDFGPFRAVDGVSFTVDKGCVLGFLGPNGAGKSTTMKMLTGLPHAHLGLRLHPRPRRRRRPHRGEAASGLDERELRRMMTNLLEREGYRVLEASNSEEALWLARARKFDLLVTDVVMPGLSGRALARQVSTLRPEAPVLYVSGYTADTLSDHGVLHADVELLEKPFSPAELLAHVRRILDVRPRPVSAPAVPSDGVERRFA